MPNIILIVFSLIAFLFCINDACQGENGEFAPDILRIGYSTKLLNSVSLADAQVALELWTRQLKQGSSLKMQSKPLIYDNLQAMANALKNREIQFVAMTTMDYLKIKDKVPVEAAFFGNKRNSLDGDEIVLLVRRDAGIKDIKQLKGKRLMVHGSPMLDSIHLWLNSVMARSNLPDHELFFGSDKEVKKVSQAVLPVFFRQAESAVVSRSSFEAMVELNPQIGKELMVLLHSDKLLEAIFCFHKQLRADIKARMTEVALNIKETPTGKQILTLFQIDAITPFKPSLLDTTVSLLNMRHQPNGRLLVEKRRE